VRRSALEAGTISEGENFAILRPGTRAEQVLRPALEPQDKVRTPTTNLLHAELAAMNAGNFIVRMHLEAVSKFKDQKDQKAWDALSDADRETL